MRIAEIKRKTNETDIEVKLNLDGKGNYSINTGIGFLDHMLSHLAVHGIFDLYLTCQGDLNVDPHHTIEDCALVIGQAFDQALSDRNGINRVGAEFVPMDEVLAQVVVDFSGRPYSIVEIKWHNPEVGGIPTSSFQHFLESFAVKAKCNLHARVLYGRDDHHQAEAVFKCLGRSLQKASRIDPRRADTIPSTKGTLT